MNSVLPGRRVSRLAPWVNLVLPGGGLILVGSVWSGLLAGLAFAGCANFILAAILLFPDDFPRAGQILVLGLAAVSYVGTQLRLARSVLELRARDRAEHRARLLRETQECLARGEVVRAVAALEPLAEQAGHDLLIAYRLAQARSAAGDLPGARAAWHQVRQLDRHGIYRRQVREAENGDSHLFPSSRNR